MYSSRARSLNQDADVLHEDPDVGVYPDANAANLTQSDDGVTSIDSC